VSGRQIRASKRTTLVDGELGKPQGKIELPVVGMTLAGEISDGTRERNRLS
jgi:hypothetical protein